MTLKKIGGGLIMAGIAGAAASLLVAFFLSRAGSIRSIGILGAEISAVLILLGLWCRNAATSGNMAPREQFQALAGRILDAPVIAWVLAGFLIVYLLFFVAPVFLSPRLQMNYVAGYIPNLNPIGNDLIVMLDQIKGWMGGNQSPYTVQFYPPLTYVLFAPLLLFKDYLTLYRFFTLFTFTSYCLLTLWLPLKIIGSKHLPLAFLLFIPGLFSYGFQFEVERGQYNVFTFLLCLSAIYVFHYHRRYRLLAYLLFSLSIQLKLYPALFVVMFVDDWRDWKGTLLRFVELGIFNVMLFFVMGYRIFWDFVRSVSAQLVNPSWIGPWNHSISSFVSTVKQDGLGLIGPETLRVVRHNSGWLEAFLLLLFLVLFVSALIISHRRKEAGLDPYLLLSCTIGAMILPISYDYTLSILAAPMLLFLSGLAEMRSAALRFISVLLTLGVSISYSLTLIPSIYRPQVLQNVFPALLLILVLASILNLMRYQNLQARREEAELAARAAGNGP